MAMIFQEPMTSLEPVPTRSASQMTEVLRRHRPVPAARGARPRADLLGARRHHRARHAARPVPAPALGRPAPARDDRHGADVRAASC